MSHGSASSANVASAVNAACFKLFTTAHKGDTSPEGCFMSPLSIVYALSLALNGAGKLFGLTASCRWANSGSARLFVPTQHGVSQTGPELHRPGTVTRSPPRDFT